LFAYGVWLYFLSLTQYVYDYIKKDVFPNSTFLNASTLDSNCYNNNKSSESYQQQTKIQKDTAKWAILNSVAEKIPGIFANSMIATLSDRYGRKNLLNVILAGEFIKSTLFFALIYLNVNIYYLILATAVQGFTGGLFGAKSVALAYMADITTSKKERTLMITILEMSVGIGATISDFASGYFIEKIGYVYSMAVASGFIVSSMILINICLWEYRVVLLHERESFSKNLTNVFKFYTQDTSTTAKRWKYILCMIIFIIACFAYHSKGDIDILYLLNWPFCWSSVKIGWYFSVLNLVNNCLGVCSIKLFQKFTKASEVVIGIISSLSNALSCVLEGLSYTDFMMFLGKNYYNYRQRYIYF